MFEITGSVARITLNNPPLNVIDLEMIGALRDHLIALEQKPNVTAIVFAGNERVFSAGMDVASLAPQTVEATLNKFHAVVREQLQKFLLKRDAPVVLLLVLDISNHGAAFRFADAECSVSALPGEFAALGPSLFRPSRRIGLDHAQAIGHREMRRQARQHMHMIRSATNDNGNGLEPAKNSAEIGMHFGTYSLVEQGQAAGSGEYRVHEDAGVGVRHDCFLAGAASPLYSIGRKWA